MKISASASNHGVIFTLLVILALTTVGLHLLNFQGMGNNLAVFGVATVMAALVGMQYMGLKLEGPIVVSMVVVSFVLFAILVGVLIPDFVLDHTAPAFPGASSGSGH